MATVIDYGTPKTDDPRIPKFGDLTTGNTVVQDNQKTSSTTLLEGADLKNFGSKVNGSTDTFTKGTSSAETKSSAQLKSELDELKSRKDANYLEIEKIEKTIESLVKEAKDAIKDAIQEQKEKVDGHEKAVERVAQQELDKYVAANKNGDGMTKDELAKNIKGALPNMPNLSFVDRVISSVNKIIGDIKTNIISLNSLICSTQVIENEIPIKQAAYEAALKAEQSDEDGGSTSISIDDIETDPEIIESYTSTASAASLLRNFGYVNSGAGNTYFKNQGLTLNSTLDSHRQVSNNANGSVSLIQNDNENLGNQKDVSKNQIESASERIPSKTVSSAEDFPEKTDEIDDKNDDKSTNDEQDDKNDKLVYSYNSKGEVISTDKDGRVAKIKSPSKDKEPKIDSNGKLIFVQKEDEIEEN